MKANKLVFEPLSHVYMSTFDISKINKSKSHISKGNFFFLIAIALSSSACSNLGVEPWERDLLSKKEMALTSSPIDAALDDHIYFSKEASSGGKSFGGGGCGCN